MLKILCFQKNAYICNTEKQLKPTIIEKKLKKMEEKSQKTELFTIFEIEFVNEETGQVVTLTTTCGSYKELGKYLTEMNKKSWRMLKVKRKED